MVIGVIYQAASAVSLGLALRCTLKRFRKTESWGTIKPHPSWGSVNFTRNRRLIPTIEYIVYDDIVERVC